MVGLSFPAYIRAETISRYPIVKLTNSHSPLIYRLKLIIVRPCAIRSNSHSSRIYGLRHVSFITGLTLNPHPHVGWDPRLSEWNKEPLSSRSLSICGLNQRCFRLWKANRSLIPYPYTSRIRSHRYICITLNLHAYASRDLYRIRLSLIPRLYTSRNQKPVKSRAKSVVTLIPRLYTDRI